MRSDRRQYDTTYSLRQLALTSYTEQGARQYGNIYQRGAVVAGLLDIRLLQLSNGQHGLRDLVLDLARECATPASSRALNSIRRAASAQSATPSSPAATP